MLNPLKNVLTVEMARSLIAKIKGALATKVSMGDVVSSWQSTPDDAHVPTEKLVKDTLDNLPPGTAVKGDAESEYRTGNVNLTPANIGSYSKTESDNLLNAKENAVNKKQSVDPTSTTDFLSAKAVADFVNSSVATNTANFLGSFSLTDLGLTYPATYVQIAAALNNHTWPTGVTPTNNDYVYIEIANPSTPAIDDKVERFKYSDALASWGYEYTLNNSSFTAAEIAAIDSGITATDKGNYDAHLLDTSNPHNVTKAQVGLGNVVNTGDSATPEQGGTEKFTTGGAYTELAKKLDKNGDGTDVTTTPTTEADYTKPTAATKLSVLFGKLWYFVSRLRTSIRATSSASDTEFPSEKAVATALAGLVSQNGIARSDGAVIAPFMYNNTDTTILGYPGYQVWFRIELSGRKTYLATITIKATTNTKSVQVAIDTLKVEESNVLVNDVAIRYVAGEQDLLEYAGNDNPNNINNIKFFKCKDSGGTHYLAIKCGYAVPNESMNAAVSVICYDYTQSTTPIQRNTYNTNTWPDWCTNWEQRFAIIDAENTPTFSEAASRVNLVGSDETMPTILGKIKKWFADIGTAAFKTLVTSWSETASDSNIPSEKLVKTELDGKYVKPSDGIPKTDLASDVQTSLGKADSALQSHQAVSDKNPTLAWGATSTVGTVGSTNLQVTMPSNPASGKLDTNGDGSNVTAAFTAANTRANISTGEKLSVIFGKIAKWFADLKALAFKDSVGTSDINDDAITAAKVKDNETLPVNISGSAASASSVAWSNVSSKPTKLSDFTDDITQQNYSVTSTNPQSGTAVAQAVAKSYVATVYSGGSVKSFKAIELSLIGNTAANCLLGMVEVNVGGSTAQCMFDINVTYTASSHTVGTVVNHLFWLANKTNNLKLAYSIDTATDKLTIYVKNLNSWYSAQIRVLTAQMEGANRLGNVTMFDGTSVTLPDSAVEFTELNSRDASWINSGTFDAARIPASLPAVTAGYASQVNVIKELGGAFYFVGVSSNSTGNKALYTPKNIYAYHDANNGAILIIGLSGGEKSVARSGHLRLGNGAYTGFIYPQNLTASRTYQLPDDSGTFALQNGSYSGMSAGNLTPSGTSGQYLKSNGSGTAPSWENPSDMTAGYADSIHYANACFNPAPKDCNVLLASSYTLDSAYDQISMTFLVVGCRADSLVPAIGILEVNARNSSASPYIPIVTAKLSVITNASNSLTDFNKINVTKDDRIIRIYATRFSAGSDYAGVRLIPLHSGTFGTGVNTLDRVTLYDNTGTAVSSRTGTDVALEVVYLAQSGGTSGQYLKSTGANAAPVWDNTSNLSVGTTQNVATQGAASSSNNPRHIWFSDYLTETKRAHDDNLEYTPATNTISANISGSAAKVGGKKIVVGTLGTDTDTIYFLTGA